MVGMGVALFGCVYRDVYFVIGINVSRKDTSKLIPIESKWMMVMGLEPWTSEEGLMWSLWATVTAWNIELYKGEGRQQDPEAR